MAYCTHLVFRSSTKMRAFSSFLLFAFALVPCVRAQLPAGPGQAEVQAICTQCHELARAIAPRQDKAGWQATVDKMITLGAKGSDKDFQVVVDYLAKNYPGDEVPRINVNEARPKTDSRPKGDWGGGGGGRRDRRW